MPGSQTWTRSRPQEQTGRWTCCHANRLDDTGRVIRGHPACLFALHRRAVVSPAGHKGESRVNGLKAEAAMSDERKVCQKCGRPKSEHTPFVRKQADKPLGLEPNGWFCPMPPHS